MQEKTGKNDSAIRQKREYSLDDIATVVITYNGKDFSKVISILQELTTHIIIVDNGSNDTFVKSLDQYDDHSAITIIKNRENKGQAEALNQGWKEAEKQGYRLVLTMDQDSLLGNECVTNLLYGINEGFDSVGPNYENKKMLRKFEEVKYLITSGNLMIIESLKEIGGYNSNLFIDSVDFDVSLRLRKAGYKLAIARDAKMQHSIGESRTNNKGEEIFEHSAKRHYYIARNHYYIVYKYWKFDPVFCVRKQLAYFLSLIKVRKESESQEKYAARVRGKREAKNLIKKDRIEE